MEKLELSSAVHGYHVYKDISEPLVGDKLIAQREFNEPPNLQKQWPVVTLF